MMKETLAPGIVLEKVWTVTTEMAPPHLPAPVLSTPSMIGLIELTCLESVQPHLDDNETTVGTHVNVSHVGLANAGEDVTVRTRVTKINKRRIEFQIEVLSPRGLISAGAHERAVIDLARWGAKK